MFRKRCLTKLSIIRSSGVQGCDRQMARRPHGMISQAGAQDRSPAQSRRVREGMWDVGCGRCVVSGESVSVSAVARVMEV